MTAASPTLFVGIDIAAKTLAAARLRPGEAVSRPITLTQSSQGFATLHERLGQTGGTPTETHVVMEAIGSYWIALATTLAHTGYRASVINPAQAHHFAKALLKRDGRCPNRSSHAMTFVRSFSPRWRARDRVPSGQMELSGSDDAHGEHLAVAGFGEGMGAMPAGAQQIVKRNEDGYNQGVVHRWLLQEWLVSATPCSGCAPMNVYS